MEIRRPDYRGFRIDIFTFPGTVLAQISRSKYFYGELDAASVEAAELAAKARIDRVIRDEEAVTRHMRCED